MASITCEGGRSGPPTSVGCSVGGSGCSGAAGILGGARRCGGAARVPLELGDKPEVALVAWGEIWMLVGATLWHWVAEEFYGSQGQRGSSSSCVEVR